MFRHAKVLSIIGLAIALSPAFANARNGEGVGWNRPVKHLVEIPSATASMLHGRAAERAPLQPTFTVAGPAIEDAENSGDSMATQTGG